MQSGKKLEGEIFRSWMITGFLGSYSLVQYVSNWHLFLISMLLSIWFVSMGISKDPQKICMMKNYAWIWNFCKSWITLYFGSISTTSWCISRSVLTHWQVLIFQPHPSSSWDCSCRTSVNHSLFSFSVPVVQLRTGDVWTGAWRAGEPCCIRLLWDVGCQSSTISNTFFPDRMTIRNIWNIAKKKLWRLTWLVD